MRHWFVSLSGLEATDDRPLVVTSISFNPTAILVTFPANPKLVSRLIVCTANSGSQVGVLLGPIGSPTIYLPSVGSSIQFDKDLPYWGEINIGDGLNFTTCVVLDLSLP
jgi:hypothetical protein